eukprot:PhM_4_TR2849/c4_g1_i1/m.36919
MVFFEHIRETTKDPLFFMLLKKKRNKVHERLTKFCVKKESHEKLKKSVEKCFLKKKKIHLFDFPLFFSFLLCDFIKKKNIRRFFSSFLSIFLQVLVHTALLLDAEQLSIVDIEAVHGHAVTEVRGDRLLREVLRRRDVVRHGDPRRLVLVCKVVEQQEDPRESEVRELTALVVGNQDAVLLMTTHAVGRVLQNQGCAEVAAEQRQVLRVASAAREPLLVAVDAVVDGVLLVDVTDNSLGICLDTGGPHNSLEALLEQLQKVLDAGTRVQRALTGVDERLVKVEHNGDLLLKLRGFGWDEHLSGLLDHGGLARAAGDLVL